MDKYNPFCPDKPIPPQSFAGRENEISILLGAIQRTACGNSQQLFISGERGIGKTSLAHYGFSRTRPKENEILGIYFPANDHCGIDQLCQAILKEFERNAAKNLLTEVIDFLRKRVKIKLQLPVGEAELSKQDYISEYATDFAYLLEDIIDKIGDKYKGYCIFIDEMERISRIEGIASFFKSLSEKLIIDGYNNIMFALIGIPRAFEDLERSHASVVRIFTPIKLGLMTLGESKDIIRNALINVGTEIDENALHLMASLSSGYPALIHEIGYFAYEVDTDNRVDVEDVIKGLAEAMVQLQRKYFDKMFLSDIQSDTYREILNIIATSDSEVVDVSYIRSHFMGNPSVLNSYLGRLVDRKLLNRVSGGRGLYKLPNLPFKIYIRVLNHLPRNSNQNPLLIDETVSTSKG